MGGCFLRKEHTVRDIRFCVWHWRRSWQVGGLEVSSSQFPVNLMKPRLYSPPSCEAQQRCQRLWGSQTFISVMYGLHRLVCKMKLTVSHSVPRPTQEGEIVSHSLPSVAKSCLFGLKMNSIPFLLSTPTTAYPQPPSLTWTVLSPDCWHWPRLAPVCPLHSSRGPRFKG